jgi:hypothetical protein
MLGLEGCMFAYRVARHPNHADAGFSERIGKVGKGQRLPGASRCVVLGIEIDDGRLALEFVKVDRVSVAAGQ